MVIISQLVYYSLQVYTINLIKLTYNTDDKGWVKPIVPVVDKVCPFIFWSSLVDI